MRRLQFVLIWCALGLSFASCIQSKSITYLQNDLQTTPENVNIPEPPDYKILPGYLLSIHVVSASQGEIEPYTNESKGFRIDELGDLDMPNIGTISLAGKTLAEARDIIRNEVKKYTKDAYVKVSLASIDFYTLGFFGNSGMNSTKNPHLNIFEAIALAGGLKTTADFQHITLIRTGQEGPKIHELDLTKLSIVESEFFYVHPGDQFYAKPSKAAGIRRNGIVVDILKYAVGLSGVIFLGLVAL